MRFWSICLLTLSAQAAVFADNSRPPIYIAAGLDYLSSASRALVGNEDPHLALGWSDTTSALFGIPSLDLDWSHGARNGNSIDTFGLTYCERRALSQYFYFGLGIGTFYNRVKLEAPDGSTDLTTGFRIGGRGMLGIYLSSTVFFEATYFYTGKVNGVSTNAISGCLGLWF